MTMIKIKKDNLDGQDLFYGKDKKEQVLMDIYKMIKKQSLLNIV